jgi:type VI secretion system secreted protein VgrG
VSDFSPFLWKAASSESPCVRSFGRVQNRTTADILAEVFEGHSHAPGHYRFDLHGRGATHSYCTQYDSDHNFVHRLMESEGWFTYIEQAENGKSHTVVVTDDMYRFKPLDTQDVDFYRAERWTGADALVEWSSERIVQSVAYGMRTADYKRPSWPKERSGISTDEHGEVPSELEIYEYAGHYSFPPAEGGTDRGSLAVQYRLEAYESRTKRFYGNCGEALMVTIDAELEAHILRSYHVEKWRCGAIAWQLPLGSIRLPPCW